MTKKQPSFEDMFNLDAMKKMMEGAGWDDNELMKMYRENMEALAAANKESADMAKEVAKLQTEFAKESWEDMTSFWTAWAGAGANVQEKADLQQKAVQESLKKAAAHNEKVAKMLKKSQEKMTKDMTEKMKETMDKASQVAKKATKK